VSTFYRKKNMDANSELDGIHYMAEEFLKDPWAKEANTFVTGAALPLLKRPLPVQYIITRDHIPAYFAGVKPSGSVAWSYDKRFAKLLTKRESELWTERFKFDSLNVKVEIKVKS
jgi:hypothetical protein